MRCLLTGILELTLKEEKLILDLIDVSSPAWGATDFPFSSSFIFHLMTLIISLFL